MANNRLYIVDEDTGERFLLAKSMGRGWYFFAGDGVEERIAKLNDWLSVSFLRDAAAALRDSRTTRLRLVTERELLDAEEDASDV